MICPHCNGDGELEDDDDFGWTQECSYCDGTGVIEVVVGAGGGGGSGDGGADSGEAGEAWFVGSEDSRGAWSDRPEEYRDVGILALSEEIIERSPLPAAEADAIGAAFVKFMLDTWRNGTDASPAPPPTLTPQNRTSAEPWWTNLIPFYDAIKAMKPDPGISHVADAAAPSPAYSTETNRVLDEIRRLLEAHGELKLALVTSGPVVDAVNTLRPNGAPFIPLVPKGINFSARAAKELAPETAYEVNDITKERLRAVIRPQLVRSDMSAAERRMWNRMYQAVSTR